MPVKPRQSRRTKLDSELMGRIALELDSGQVDVRQVAHAYGVSVRTIYRYIGSSFHVVIVDDWVLVVRVSRKVRASMPPCIVDWYRTTDVDDPRDEAPVDGFPDEIERVPAMGVGYRGDWTPEPESQVGQGSHLPRSDWRTARPARPYEQRPPEPEHLSAREWSVLGVVPGMVSPGGNIGTPLGIRRRKPVDNRVPSAPGHP